MELELPDRSEQHIKETASYKLFASKIPDKWIIRDLGKDDYGIDCYLELVNEKNRVTGDLVLIQLKSTEEITWTVKDTFTHYNVKMSTTNYWYKLNVPVFIFVADIKRKEIFCKSVDQTIKSNFNEFLKQKTFHYKFEKKELFDGEKSISNFKVAYNYEKYRNQFENELLFFISNLENFQNFQRDHWNRDYHLGVEDTDLIYFEAMHRNFDFLSDYLNVTNPIPNLNELKRESSKKFKQDFYELYEQDLSEWMESFEKLMIKLIKEAKQFIEDESEYWINTNLTVFNYINNIQDDGTLPFG